MDAFDTLTSSPLGPGCVPAGVAAALRELVPLDAAILDGRPRSRRAVSRWLVRAERVPALVAALAEDHGVLVTGGERLPAEEVLHLDAPGQPGLRAAARGRVPRHEVRLRRLPALGACLLEVESRLPGRTLLTERRPHPLRSGGLSPEETAWALGVTGWPGAALLPQAVSSGARVTLFHLAGLGRVTIELGMRLDRPPLTRRLPALALVALEAEAADPAGLAARTLRALGARRHGAGPYAAALGLLDPGGDAAGRLAPALRAMEALAARNDPSHAGRTPARGPAQNEAQEAAPMKPTKPLAALARIAAVAALLVSAGRASAQEGPPPGPPRTPPQEAIQACTGKAASDACQVTMGDRTEAGTCFAFDGSTLACRPARGPGGRGGHRGPPPEAVEACKEIAEGEACAVTLGGDTLDGTCAKGPDGNGPLACRPSRMPAPSGR